MDASSKIKALLQMKGIKQTELIPVLGLSSPQALTNKFRRNAWSVDDLIKVCEFLECTVFIETAEGDKIVLKD